MSGWQDIAALGVVGLAAIYLGYVGWGWWKLRRTCRCAQRGGLGRQTAHRQWVQIEPPRKRDV